MSTNPISIRTKCKITSSKIRSVKENRMSVCGECFVCFFICVSQNKYLPLYQYNRDKGQSKLIIPRDDRGSTKICQCNAMVTQVVYRISWPSHFNITLPFRSSLPLFFFWLKTAHLRVYISLAVPQYRKFEMGCSLCSHHCIQPCIYQHPRFRVNRSLGAQFTGSDRYIDKLQIIGWNNTEPQQYGVYSHN